MTQSEVQDSSLTGLGSLIRLMLRRDRIRLWAWSGGMGLFALYVVVAIPTAYGNVDDLKAAAALFAEPMSRVLIGPAFGFEDPSIEQLVANGYGLYFGLLAALMSIFTVIRHTRADEQTQRAELLRANVVGRHATLTAALIVTVLTNLVSAVAVVLVALLVGRYPVQGTLLFAAGIALTGLAFAGVAAITAQLSEFSRGASGMAGAVLGAVFVVRAGGDMVAVGGSALSWFSPLAWPGQTAPFVLDRWWPLALSLVFAILTTALGYWLSTRRDFGASRFQVRAGSSSAPARWGSALGWAWRQQRSLIISWTAALAIGALAFGAFAQSLQEAELPEMFKDVFSSDDLLMGYISYMTTFMAYFVAAFSVMAIQSLRSEETSTLLEPIAAMPLSRTSWLLAQVSVTAIASAGMLLLVGWSAGVGAAFATGKNSLVVDLGWAHLNAVPAVLVVLGLAALLFGFAPRLIGVTWLVVGYSMFAGSFGGLLNLPQWALDLSPFAHPAAMPLEDFALQPVLVLVAIAGAGIALACVGFRRRDISGG